MQLTEYKKVIPLQVSKWVKIPLLLDLCEMEDLISHLPSFALYDLQRVVGIEEGIYHPKEFLKEYSRYIHYLKEGVVPPVKEFRMFFSTAWSLDEGALYVVPTTDGRRLIRASQPVIQTQINEIGFSAEEKIFRTQVFGSETVSWGIQVGFPFLFMHPTTYEAEKTRHYPNMTLFVSFQRWVRQFTLPTPFLVNGERINSPIRIGKKCFSWIANHPQLKQLNIQIDQR